MNSHTTSFVGGDCDFFLASGRASSLAAALTHERRLAARADDGAALRRSDTARDQGMGPAREEGAVPGILSLSLARGGVEPHTPPTAPGTRHVRLHPPCT